jgi:hypothetical protein
MRKSGLCKVEISAFLRSGKPDGRGADRNGQTGANRCAAPPVSRDTTLRTDADALTRTIIALAKKYGHYGYRRITVLLSERPGTWAEIKWSNLS